MFARVQIPGASAIRRLAVGTSGSSSVRSKQAIDSVVALVCALVVGAILIIAVGKDPLSAYGALWHGAFGGWTAVAQSFGTSAPLILTALGVSLSFRAGFFNIGAGGQLAMGAAAAALVGCLFGRDRCA